MDPIMITGLIISFFAFISAAVIKIYRGIVSAFEPPAPTPSTELKKDAEEKKAKADESQKEADEAKANGDEDAEAKALKAKKDKEEAEAAAEKLKEVEAEVEVEVEDESTMDEVLLGEITGLKELVKEKEVIAYSTESDLAPRLDAFNDILDYYVLITDKYEEMSGGDFTNSIAEINEKIEEVVAGRDELEKIIEDKKKQEENEEAEYELKKAAEELLNMATCNELINDGGTACNKRLDCVYKGEVGSCDKISCSDHDRNASKCTAIPGCEWERSSSHSTGLVTKCTGSVDQDCDQHNNREDDCKKHSGCSYIPSRYESCEKIDCGSINIDKCSEYSPTCELKKDVKYCEMNPVICDSLTEENSCKVSGCTPTYKSVRTTKAGNRRAGGYEYATVFDKCAGSPGAGPICTPPDCVGSNHSGVCGELKTKSECRTR